MRTRSLPDRVGFEHSGYYAVLTRGFRRVLHTSLRHALAVALLSLATVACAQGPPRAQHPSYLILGAPMADTDDRHRQRQTVYPGVGVGVTAPTYNYGWFGAAPQRQWSRHFGYYRNYTQWTRR